MRRKNWKGFGSFRDINEVDEWRTRGTYIYINPETWRLNKLAEIQDLVVDRGSALEVGLLGYDGQSGLYASRKLADQPYFLRSYNSLNASSDRNKDLYANIESKYTGDCMDLEDSGKCFGSKGGRIMSASADGCELWCPEGSKRGAPRIPIVVIDYDRGWLEEIMTNNNFDAAIVSIMNFKEHQERVVETVKSGNISLFYYFEPTLFLQRLE